MKPSEDWYSTHSTEPIIAQYLTRQEPCVKYQYSRLGNERGQSLPKNEFPSEESFEEVGNFWRGLPVVLWLIVGIFSD